jgi:plasmid stabilization system protein ParE
VSYTLHSGAERDIANALDFYVEQAGLVVAERFLAEFERVTQLLLAYPDLGTPMPNGRRTFALKVFPYSIVYRNLASGLQILIVRHQHRKPNYAQNRR